MILIDTNIFLEHLMGQRRAAECESLLESVSRGEREAVVSHFSLHAVEAVLNPRHIPAFLRNIENSIGLYVFDTNVSDEIAASLLASEMGLDFDDALQYYVAKRTGARTIVSFDRHFDGLDLKRSEPRAILDSKGDA